MNNYTISSEYISKIYGGVWGKIIGVRLGNPMEFAYSSAEMQRRYPFVDGYLETEREIYVDDDTNGFVFFAKIFEQIEDISELTPEILARTILNYACENRGFFWWDYENGTEANYFRNLIRGIPIKECEKFSCKEYLSHYVGGQIFYDAIGLIFAGNPILAARTAGLVSRGMHAGEGHYGAQFICACISAAFLENNTRKILDIALGTIPENCHYAKMVRDIIEVYERHPYAWTACQHFIEENYDGHAVWDYSASIVMALLYGKGDFSYSMEICLKSAGDTDCNCGNLGTILGVLNGCEKISHKRWIYPLNDVLYCSSAVAYENEVSITQFAAYLMVLFGKWNHCEIPDYIKNATKLGNFSFAFPYSYQNMQVQLWRNGNWQEEFVNRKNSFWITNGEVETSSGSPYALKFWAHCVKKDDRIILCKRLHNGKIENIEHNNIKYEPTSCTKIFPGQTVRVNIMTYDNACEMKVRLKVMDWEYTEMNDESEKYCTQGQREESCSEYQILPQNQWIELKMDVPYSEKRYNCIIIEVIIGKNSYYKDGFDGIALYLDDLAVENKPNFAVKFTPKTAPFLSNAYHYPMLENFTVCYGEVYYGFLEKNERKNDASERLCAKTSKRFWDNSSNIWSNYCRFYSGLDENGKGKSVKDFEMGRYNNQSLARDKKMAMAFTGPYFGDFCANCYIGIIPPQDTPMEYKSEKMENAALMAISVKGVVQHLAVGFYHGKMAILRTDRLPGEYVELAAKPYVYDLQGRYYFEVETDNGEICFWVTEVGDDGKLILNKREKISYNIGRNLYGCIGFVGIGYGITVYQYSVRGK